MARAFVAKAVLGIPTTSALIDRLGAEKSLRRVCGWERRAQVPSEATFFPRLHGVRAGGLPDRMHAALINRALGGRIIGAIARDATEIEAREKPVEKDKKDGPPPPSASVPPQRKYGRPRKGQERSSERPKPEPTRLERQTTLNAS